MLERETLKAIGRTLRTVYEEQPKGGIPDEIWRLLLDLERAEKTAAHSE